MLWTAWLWHTWQARGALILAELAAIGVYDAAVVAIAMPCGSPARLFRRYPVLGDRGEALEFIDDDELVEVTPAGIRLRK